MQHKVYFWLSLVLFAGAGGPPAVAADPCLGFKWDVSKEHALFGGPSIALSAGKDVASAPTIGADRLYRLQLVPQSKVAFALAPGKKTSTDAVFAGLAALKLAAPGDYRVSVDAPFWVDVVADGKLATTKDFQGQHGCDAPHKIVEFDLTATRELILQMSGSATATVRLTVTRAPARP
jgi:hypothetical protein